MMRSIGAAAALLLAATFGPARLAAQAPSPQDSLLACADREARAAGFAPAGPARPGRLLLMRPQNSPGASHLLDALRVSVSDSAGQARLSVRVGSFLVSGSTGLTEQDVPPRASLLAFADTLKARCR